MPRIHLNIAIATWQDDVKPWNAKCATGVGVRTLVDLAMKFGVNGAVPKWYRASVPGPFRARHDPHPTGDMRQFTAGQLLYSFPVALLGALLHLQA
jgi:hypothetical protein